LIRAFNILECSSVNTVPSYVELIISMITALFWFVTQRIVAA